jgi:hypothetical protein
MAASWSMTFQPSICTILFLHLGVDGNDASRSEATERDTRPLCGDRIMVHAVLASKQEHNLARGTIDVMISFYELSAVPPGVGTRPCSPKPSCAW